nr:adenylosuccinate synthetase [Acidimicrobiia bacterium]
LNSLTEIFLTKLDILSPLETLKVCVAYDIDGRRVEHLPYHQTDLHTARPIFEELPGWGTDICDARTLGELPTAARDYVIALGDLAKVPVSYVGVGPERLQTVHVA